MFRCCTHLSLPFKTGEHCCGGWSLDPVTEASSTQRWDTAACLRSGRLPRRFPIACQAFSRLNMAGMISHSLTGWVYLSPFLSASLDFFLYPFFQATSSNYRLDVWRESRGQLSAFVGTLLRTRYSETSCIESH